MSFRFPKTSRLRKRREFLPVQSRGRKFHGRYVLVLVLPGPAPAGRLGITVSKRVGNAVVRNRVRRWVREFVRQGPSTAWLPTSTDVVVIAKASAAKAPSFHAIADDLRAVGAAMARTAEASP